MNFPGVIALLGFAAAATPGVAADWRYYVGVHDFVTPQVDSHAYGLSGRATVDGLTKSGRHYFGSADLFWDHDQDHLDSDHIPIWWQLNAGIDGQWSPDTSKTRVGWVADINTRMNTTSSIERQIKVLPALVAGYYGDAVQTSIKGGIGWLFLEIDDDAPKERGYTRDTLRNTTVAGAIDAQATFKLGGSCKFSVQGQQWWGSDQWLQSQYTGAFHIAVGKHERPADLIVSGEYNEYNLDPYAVEGLPPVLGWDHDFLVRVLLETAW